MRKPTDKNIIPRFKSAAEKRAWLLLQLAEVETEALFEELAAGKDEAITIRAGDTFSVTVGKSALYEGADAARFAAILARMIQTLPLGSTFVVEAGRGGKVLGSARPEPEPPEPVKRTRTQRKSPNVAG